MTAAGRIRADPLRGTESLYGPGRAHRPTDFHGSEGPCPFCPGSEARTGALLTADPGPRWESRVVANLYPSVIEPDGRHEVIVEVRDHTASWALLAVAEIERILRVYRGRELAALADGFVYTTMYKNSGAAAGASLRHPHAQVVALSRLPRSVALRLERLDARCVVCATLVESGERVVLRTPEIVAYVPDGSRTAFEVRIAPAAHAARFSASPELLPALAGVIAGVMRRLTATLGEDMPFNLIVQSAPRDPRAQTYWHWEIEVIPRIENLGGFELGTGGFLVSRLPEEAAALLRAAAGVAHA